jgi:hypothetical protein
MKTTVSVPNDYSSVTVAQWKQLEREWSNCRTDKQKTAKAVQVLAGLDEAQVAALTAAQFNKIVSHLEWVMDAHERDHELVPRFTLKGVPYGFIPDWDSLSTGEFIDLETYSVKGMGDHLPQVMAVMFRRITEDNGEWYEIEPYSPSDRKTGVMKDAPMDAVMGALGFFLTTGRGLAIDSHLYGQKVARLRRSDQSGGGIRRFTRWLKGMFSKSKK